MIGLPWWICRRWAIDLFLDPETRPHADLDVGALRRDVGRALSSIPGWEAFEAQNGALGRLRNTRDVTSTVVSERWNAAVAIRAHKANHARPRDELDFESVVPHLSEQPVTGCMKAWFIRCLRARGLTRWRGTVRPNTRLQLAGVPVENLKEDTVRISSRLLSSLTLLIVVVGANAQAPVSSPELVHFAGGQPGALFRHRGRCSAAAGRSSRARKSVGGFACRRWRYLRSGSRRGGSACECHTGRSAIAAGWRHENRLSHDRSPVVSFWTIVRGAA